MDHAEPPTRADKFASSWKRVLTVRETGPLSVGNGLWGIDRSDRGDVSDRLDAGTNESEAMIASESGAARMPGRIAGSTDENHGPNRRSEIYELQSKNLRTPHERVVSPLPPQTR